MSKILVIEDERILRKSLVRLLCAEGYEVIAADNGTLGIELAKQESPQLILCDLMMPGIDGYEVLSELQTDSQTAMIPFICLTARDERTALRQVMEFGGDDFLTKPFSRTELLRSIQTQLNKQQRILDYQKNAVEDVIVSLTHQDSYDGLTHLPNRLLLRDRFSSLIEASEEGHFLPVMVISLQQLERVTEGLGLEYLALLFQAVIKRLQSSLPPQQTMVRLNNEQIACLLPSVAEVELILEQIETIMGLFMEPFTISGYQVILNLNIGVALYPNHGTEIDDLLRKANIATYQGRKKRHNSYEFYSDAIALKSKDRIILETDLRQALKENQFYLHYQPQYHLQTHQITGAEALLRWQHPTRGRISPGEFIPIAEETGLILDLDEWVLNAVCQQLKQWHQQGIEISIAVNLSGLQFSRQGLLTRVLKILEAHAIDASCLELELTESAVVQNPQLAEKILYDLKKLGFRLSLDDFGTGYSSLSYLHQFPFDKLKIDRCFVADITNNPRNVAILTGTILMAHGLSLRVVAEGVETDAEAHFLATHDCHTIQGYWYSRPLPVADFEFLFQQTNLA